MLLQSGVDEKCGLVQWNVPAICKMFKTSWQMGGRLTNNVLENHLPFEGPVILFAGVVEYHPISTKYGQKVLPAIFIRYALYAGGIWKGDFFLADIEELENVGRVRYPCSETQCEGN